MAEIYDFERGWQSRIEKASKVVEQACERGDATDLMDDIAKMLKEVASDSRYYAEMRDNQVKNALESEKNAIEIERNESTAKLEAERNEIERSKNDLVQAQSAQQAKSDKWKIVVSLIGTVAGPVLSVLFNKWKEDKRHERFMISSDAENNHGHSYITKTDRAVVDEALKDDSNVDTGKGFKFPFFK